jgi:thymidylate kinase
VWLPFIRSTGTTVLGDRWLEDTAIDFSLNLPAVALERCWLWTLLRRVASKPNRHFVILVPVEESVRRCRAKQEPFPDSNARRAKRLELYEQTVVRDRRLIRINGVGTADEIYGQIRNHILALANAR